MNVEAPAKTPPLPARTFKLWHLLPAPFDLIVIAAILISLLIPLFSPDLWGRLAAGHWILQHLDVPHTNLYSFTAQDYPWVNHEWLSDLGLFWITDRLGLQWLQLLRALLFGVVVGLVWHNLRRRGGVIPSVILVLGVLLGLFTALDREPLLLSCLMMALLVGVLESPRWTGLPAMLLVPVLFWAWASLHGACLVGLVLCWLYMLGEVWDASRHRADRRWLLHVPMPMLASLFCLWNPYYAALYRFGLEELWQLLGSSSQRLQLQPTLALGGLLLMLAGAVLILLAAGREVRWRLALPFLFLTPIAMVMPGYLCIWSIWGASTVMEHGQQVLRRLRHEHFSPLQPNPRELGRLRAWADRLHALSERESSLIRGPYILLFVVGLSSFFARPPVTQEAGQWPLASLEALAIQQGMPVAASDVLLSSLAPGARVLCPPEWSGYLRYQGGDGVQTFLDRRESAHPLSVVEDYERVVSALPGWESILAQYEVEVILWRPGAFFPRALVASGLWQKLYADDDSVLIHLTSDESGDAAGVDVPAHEGDDSSATPAAPTSATVDGPTPAAATSATPSLPSQASGEANPTPTAPASTIDSRGSAPPTPSPHTK